MGSISRMYQCGCFIGAFNALFKREYAHLVGNTFKLESLDLVQSESDDSLVVLELTLVNQDRKNSDGTQERIFVPLFTPFVADCDDPEEVEDNINELENVPGIQKTRALDYYKTLEDKCPDTVMYFTEEHLDGKTPPVIE